VTVYVGVPMWPFRNMVMCHMFSDSEKALEEMAQKIGMRKAWRQGGDWEEQKRIGDLVHYDIAKSKRAEAIANGAIPLNTLEEEADMLELVIDKINES
jgi:hypothetical protein